MIKEDKPVIVTIGYNRKHSLKRLLDVLERTEYPVEDITLIISIDNSGQTDVVELAEGFCWSHGEKIVRTFKEKQGLKNHILQCGDYALEYGAVIMLEDDILPSPFFYRYAIEAIAKYKDDDNVAEIGLYSLRWNLHANRGFEPLYNGFDAYFSKVVCTWGQCFTKNMWKDFREWYSKNSEVNLSNDDVPKVIWTWKKSWARYLYFYMIENDKYCVTPYQSQTTNFHEIGEHAGVSVSGFQSVLNWGERRYRFPSINEAVKYNAFQDNEQLTSDLQMQYGKKILIDFYGLHNTYDKYQLCLSSALLPFEAVQKWGLEMKPYELNIYYDIEGNDIILYDLEKSKKVRRDWQHHAKLVEYDIRLIDWVDIFFYAIYTKIKKLFSKD